MTLEDAIGIGKRAQKEPDRVSASSATATTPRTTSATWSTWRCNSKT
jgi:hypothetical protein